MTDDHKHDNTPACSHGDSPSSGSMLNGLIAELRAHVPFSVSAVTIGLIVAGLICVLGGNVSDGNLDRQEVSSQQAAESSDTHDHSEPPSEAAHEHKPSFATHLFHLFHPAHMLFSAAATTAMFRRYDRKKGKAVLVGIIGAVGICGVSDILIPHASLILLGRQTAWHICILEHPDLVLPFAAIGVLMGLWAASDVLRSTLISHSLHVFTSTMASIFYLVGSLGAVAWINDIGQVFVFVVIAVMVPCCVSDIIFPLLMTKPNRDAYLAAPHTH